MRIEKGNGRKCENGETGPEKNIQNIRIYRNSVKNISQNIQTIRNFSKLTSHIIILFSISNILFYYILIS